MKQADRPSRSRLGRVRWRLLVGLWLLAAVASGIWRWTHPWEPTLRSGDVRMEVPLADRGGPIQDAEPIRIVFTDTPVVDAANAGVPVVLLHGSPGGRGNFDALVDALPRDRRLLAIDLPGYGASERDLPDYSNRALAHMLVALLDGLGIPSAHLVGYSMGGGVALELSEFAPERIASMTLLSSIGAQELELFGDYTVNHAIHGLQVAFLWALHNGVPHFGAWDGSILSVAYARNFYDTDQRPLRERSLGWDGPTAILHGVEDSLAPYAVAVEAARLMPQAELVPLEGGHMVVFSDPASLVEPLVRTWSRAEDGTATRRSDVSGEALAASLEPFDPSLVPPLDGIGLFVFFLLTILATMLSEDLTCVAVGALVGQGRVDLAAGALACFLGIYVGDLLVFLAGRFFGRRAVHRAPLRWFLSEARVERSSAWFRSKGAAVIFLSRFLPGARLPTYFAAGMLRTSFLSFAGWFAIAAGLWTPLVVWLSSLLSGSLTERVEFLHQNGLWALAITIALGLLVVKVLVPMTSHKGRRLLLGSWRRKTRWEYWPPLLVYPPAVVAAIFEGLRRRSPLAFTASNPGIPHAGFVGESKAEILTGFADAGDCVPPWEFVAAEAGEDELLARLRELQARLPEAWPVVVKPDVGQRGDGVVVARSEEDVTRAARAFPFGTILQAYVPGREYGLFWAREPGADGVAGEGRILSVVDKRLPTVTGDGARTLEELILDDDRAVAMAPFFLDRNAQRLADVPDAGEVLSIGELGTHCKGALFLDGNHLVTPALVAAVAAFADAYRDPRGVWTGEDGFAFGRLDVRAASEDELRAGHFRLIEVNGVTSESAHVYDPRHGVLTGWRTLAAQWVQAQRVGAAQIRAGARASRVSELLAAVRTWRRALREAEAAPLPGGKDGGRTGELHRDPGVTPAGPAA